MLLLIIGLLAVRGREAVAGVVGFGAFPTLLFVYVIVSFPPAPNTAVFYYVYGVAIVFGAIAVAGLVALVLVWRATRRGSGPATT